MILARLLSGDEREIARAAERLDTVALEAERAALVRIVEDPAAELDERRRAGLALALVGDPRAAHEEPPVVTVAPGPARLGTRLDQVERLRARHRELDELALGKETPQHEAHVAVFALARYPVTNAEYARFVGDTAHPAPPPWQAREPARALANHPVHGVSWADAVAYCGWLTRRTGHVWRLPDEREWEKAARGGDARAFPWGDDFAPGRANSREAGLGGTTPIGAFPAGMSPHGVFDLAGNVAEWTNSWFALYEGCPYPADRYRDETRVLRGGSFRSAPGELRCAARGRPPQGDLLGVGFRLVRSLTGR